MSILDRIGFGLCLLVTAAISACGWFQKWTGQESDKEVIRGASTVVRPMTDEERADELVRAINLMRGAGWEPSLEDVKWPEDWQPPEDWEPPNGWLPPTWWPET